MKELLSVKEVAWIIDVHPATVRRWVASGKITPVSNTGRHKFTRDEVQRFLLQRQKQARDAAHWQSRRAQHELATRFHLVFSKPEENT